MNEVNNNSAQSIEQYKELFTNARRQLNQVINFGQSIIETYRENIQRNFLIRFPMLLLHEALQSGRGFLLLTKEDSINYPSGAIVLLRNGFESIVWGCSCLDDKDGKDLIGYIWNHQDIILEKDMKIYRKWKLPYSEEALSFCEEAKKRLDKIVPCNDKFILKGKPIRESFMTGHVKKIFKALVDQNGLFKYFYETSYQLTTNVWHSSAFAMRLTQYEEVRYYFLGNVANGFLECLKVFCTESIRKLTGTNNLASSLYKGMSESLRKQMQEIESGKDVEIKPSIKVILNFQESKEKK